MPEVGEVVSHFLTLVQVFELLLVPSGVTVKNLWFDRQFASEQLDMRSATGCIGILRPDGANTPARQGGVLWPEHLTQAQLRTLRLKDFDWNHRCLYLEFADSNDLPTWLSVRINSVSSADVVFILCPGPFPHPHQRSGIHDGAVVQ